MSIGVGEEKIEVTVRYDEAPRISLREQKCPFCEEPRKLYVDDILILEIIHQYEKLSLEEYGPAVKRKLYRILKIAERKNCIDPECSEQALEIYLKVLGDNDIEDN